MGIRVFVRKQPDRENFTLYYKDPLTKREKTRSAGTSDKRLAERAARDWERDLVEFHGSDGTGWAYFRDRFTAEHLAFKADDTQTAYATALNQFARIVKPSDLSGVTSGTMSTFAATLLQEGKPHSTVKNYLTHMRAALKWAERVGMMRKAPVITMPRSPNRRHMKGRPLTWRELGKLLKACRIVRKEKAGPWRRFIKLLWLSGLRLGEAQSLSWDDGTLVVRLDAKPYPLILIESAGHKARSDTAIPITPDLARWLSRTPPDRRRGLVAPVMNAVGKPFPTEKLSLHISAIGEASGVVVSDDGKKQKHASAHDLRRSFGTRWAKIVRPMTLQRMMRHKDFTTTLRYYVGLEVEDIGAELWSSNRKDA